MQGLGKGEDARTSGWCRRKNISECREGEKTKLKRTGSGVSTTEGEVNEGGKGNGTWPPVV